VSACRASSSDSSAAIDGGAAHAVCRLLAYLIPAVPAFAQSPQIYSHDGTFLGNFNADPYDADSISNPYGRYGNPHSLDSVNNPYGRYGKYRAHGSRGSLTSPRNLAPHDWRQDPIVGYWWIDPATRHWGPYR
jgi:hypothetical protein